MQTSGRVDSINPEIFHGVAGIHYFRVAIQCILAVSAPLAGNSQVDAPAPEAVDQSHCCQLCQFDGAIRSAFPLGMGEVSKVSGNLEVSFFGAEVHRLEIDRIA